MDELLNRSMNELLNGWMNY